MENVYSPRTESAVLSVCPRYKVTKLPDTARAALTEVHCDSPSPPNELRPCFAVSEHTSHLLCFIQVKAATQAATRRNTESQWRLQGEVRKKLFVRIINTGMLFSITLFQLTILCGTVSYVTG